MSEIRTSKNGKTPQSEIWASKFQTIFYVQNPNKIVRISDAEKLGHFIYEKIMAQKAITT